MPYQQGARLPGERASRLGHLEVLKSGLVQKLVKSFESSDEVSESDFSTWQPIPDGGTPLLIIFGVDGSLQIIEDELPPNKALAFVKTALLRLDQVAISAVDKDTPHPYALRDILKDSAIYHATVFPLRHVKVPGIKLYDAIRQIIFESVKDASLNGEPMETLKWIAYEKWDGAEKQLPFFECPNCEKTIATLPFDTEEGSCPACGDHIYLTDMLGFHQEMAPDAASDSVASSYMIIHETLLLFSAIKFFWEKNRQVFDNCLFIKDGPLSIRAQYSKLVNPLRRFFAYTQEQGHPIHLIGQEKTGRFSDHLQLIVKNAPSNSLFIPNDYYIKNEIQHRSDAGAPYGKDTNYGAKVFVKINEYHHMVLNFPIGLYKKDPQLKDLMGGSRIFATLPSILSNRFEGALLPVELANGVASLSTYPSAQILKVFADTKADS